MRRRLAGRPVGQRGGVGECGRRPPAMRRVGSTSLQRMKSLMGVGGGSTAGAWVTYRRVRACAWSASRRVERVSDIPRNELFRAALAVILRARERLRDVDGGPHTWKGSYATWRI